MNILLNAAPRLWPWLTVIAVCVGLEAGALYFQEIVGLYPCELCIYTRVWLTGMALVALIGIFVRGFTWPRRLALLALFGLTLALCRTTWKLLGIDYGFGNDGACSLVANFPSWAPLDQWWPMLFMIQDACSATPEVMFGLSMADGLAGVCVGFIACLLLAIVGEFKSRDEATD
ncbi:disulfide bond formation protein B [Teredinibacter turnerae]|uniref:disulfide bond formation protein B n=1 Tax=Teredinibacter turnerae TaxID=2426 RepID=UPI0003745CAC|nr:disulfide bond formation protein B [Teredinibacter turnerae]